MQMVRAAKQQMRGQVPEQGDFRLVAKDGANTSGAGRMDDVSQPQAAWGAAGGNALFCLLSAAWAIVSKGRTQAVHTSGWGPAGKGACPALQENRSRGCRRARKPLSHFAWLPLSQLAAQTLQAKLSMLTKQPLCRWNPLTPANTSKTFGRAGYGQPALTPLAPGLRGAA